MSRALRFSPLLILLLIVAALVWRLVRPVETAIPSQLVDRPVPQFQLPAAIESKPGLTSKDLAMGQPRLLNIFASWCVPCISEAPVLRELQRRGARIDAIAVRDTPEALNAFLDRSGNPYERIGGDPQSNAQIALGSSGVPETFVIDGHGVIRRQYIGALKASNIPGVLRELEQVQ